MKTVEQLACEAGMYTHKEVQPEIQRFHDLAIAQYREGLLVGVGERVLYVNTPQLQELWDEGTLTMLAVTPEKDEADDTALYTADQVAAAVAIEREACAKVCERIDAEYEGEDVQATWCAAAIREQR